jgi:thiamine transport system permease protein
MAVGSVSLGLGFSFLAARIPFRNTVLSFVLVFLAHLVVVMPFTVRTILPGARRIPQSLSLAARTMGASDKEVYRKVEYPLLKPYRRRAMAFAFALSLGEVNATLTLGEGKVTTIPVLIYKMINQYNYQGASALAVILMAVAVTVFAVGESKGDGNGIS